MKKYEKPRLTYFFIAFFVMIFLVQLFYSFSYGEDFINDIFYTYGFSLQNILDGRFETLITSIFFHGGVSHLFLNMIALFFFGKVVELELGRKKFLLIFFTSAVVGNLAILTASLFGLYSIVVPTIGASAAIFGLMGAAMLVKPLEFVFYPYLIPVPLIMVALVYTLYNIAAFLLVLTTGASSNVSYISHIGGLSAGMIFGFKQEGSRKGLIILLFLLLLLVLTPFMVMLLDYLEIFNYVNILSGVFK
jgi:membrane associated rhomboid family serine protease